MNEKQPYTIGLVQMSMEKSLSANREKAAALVDDAAARGAQVICLPELFASRYFCQEEETARFDLAETIPGPGTEILGTVAKARGVTVIASLFEKRAPGLYHNTAAVIGPEGTVTDLYRKMHIPDDPHFYEKFYFAPGDLGFKSISTPAGPIGVLVCWDQWYPEAARLTALMGAQVLFYPTAIGWHPAERESHGAEQRAAWQTIQRSHAIANGVYVAAVNRTGFEPGDPGADGLQFWGSSFVSGPFGTVEAEAPVDGESVLVHEIDPARIEEVRRGWPFLRDRRVDAYGGLTGRYLDSGGSAE